MDLNSQWLQPKRCTTVTQALVLHRNPPGCEIKSFTLLYPSGLKDHHRETNKIWQRLYKKH